MNIHVLVWAIVLVLSLVVECMTAALVSIWFVIGALVAAISAGLGAPIWLQVVIFILISVVLGFLMYPIITKTVKNGPKLKSNVENYIGKIARVDEPINNIAGTGRVTYNGISWAARSIDDSVVIDSEHVKISAVEGAKLIVEPFTKEQ